jgi:hypothetical protein
MKPEIVQMSDVEYHRDPCDLPSLSASIGHILTNDSPAHAFEAHPKLGGRPYAPTSDMDFGTLSHAVLLKAGWERIKTVRAAEDIYVYKGTKRERLVLRGGEPFPDWKLKAAQEARDEIRESGCVPVLQRDIDEANALAEAARRQFKRGWLIASPDAYKREHALLWTERASNGMDVQCRAKLDLLDDVHGMIEDLKCPDSARPDKIGRHLETYGGPIQAAAYTSALGKIVPALQGRVRYRWTFVETRRPHCVVRRYPAGSMRQLGEVLWQQAVDLWAHCLDTGVWPGYDDEERGIEASSYAMAKLTESQGEGEAA